MFPLTLGELIRKQTCFWSKLGRLVVNSVNSRVCSWVCKSKGFFSFNPRQPSFYLCLDSSPCS